MLRGTGFWRSPALIIPSLTDQNISSPLAGFQFVSVVPSKREMASSAGAMMLMVVFVVSTFASTNDESASMASVVNVFMILPNLIER